MLHRKPIPEPVIVPISQLKSGKPRETKVENLRILRFDEFLSARSLSENSKIAYRRDIQHFLNWCDTSWSEVSPRQVTHFKDYLLRKENNSRVLKDASVARILGTLKNFYNWLLRSGYVSSDPTLAVELPSIPEPEANNLSMEVVEKIFTAIETIRNPERNRAIFGLLLHGLRASEVCGLNIGDYDGIRVDIKQAKAGSVGTVPLEGWCKELVDDYLEWLKAFYGGDLKPEYPLFVSCSNRNTGKRISYDTINKLCDQIGKIISTKFNAHQLRHTFATNLVISGMSPYHSMTLMRQKSFRNFKRYAKAAERAAAEAEFNKVSGGGSILRKNTAATDES
ncbi:MAG: tyrosine-type recombinase/integrase [Richelia sp. RM1_1_1]|nr:tyrosine-type recombinase/integrase [Richelia sp. RM1_1_1]